MHQMFRHKNDGDLKISCTVTGCASDQQSTLATQRLAILIPALVLFGCGTVQIAADKVAEMALSTVGIKIPEKPALTLPPRTVMIKLDAAQDMNAGNDGQGLSVIFRLYKLKSQNAFLTTPYSTFGNADKEKDAMGADILEARELTLSPGKTINLKENVTREASYIGVVSLFRTPSAQRWRFAFTTDDAARSGITIGLHTCAMTATSIPPIGMALSESTLLSPTRCE